MVQGNKMDGFDLGHLQYPQHPSANLGSADLLLHTGFQMEDLEYLVGAEKIDSEVPDLHFAKAKAH